MVILVGIPAYVFLHHSRWGRYLPLKSAPTPGNCACIRRQRPAHHLHGLHAVGPPRPSSTCCLPLIGIGNPTQAEGWELQAIASSVIGGTSLFGAVGSVHGPLLGAFILATINNGANLLNVNSFWQRIITGALIIIIVYFDGLRHCGEVDRRAVNRRRATQAGPAISSEQFRKSVKRFSHRNCFQNKTNWIKI